MGIVIIFSIKLTQLFPLLLNYIILSCIIGKSPSFGNGIGVCEEERITLPNYSQYLAI
jgi:hypothetical protein